GVAPRACRRPRRIFRNRVLEWLERRYRTTLRGSLRRPLIAYALAAAAAVAVAGLGATVWREFLPALDEGSIWLHAELPPGVSLQKASEMMADLRRAVNEFPEVAYVVTHTGRNDDGTDPWTPAHVEAAVGLTPYSTWPAGPRRIWSAAWASGSTGCPASRSRSASRSSTACSTRCLTRTARSPSRCSATTSTSCGASVAISSRCSTRRRA